MDVEFATIEEAVAAIREGRGVVVVDDEGRENEGDLIFAAEAATTKLVADLVKYSSGVVCAPLREERASYLGLDPMVARNSDRMGTAFTVSVDLGTRFGTTTGISARERAATVRALAFGGLESGDVTRPGHIFPLVARGGGVLERGGHTEAAVDLSSLAGLRPVGCLAELVDRSGDGSMARLEECAGIAKELGVPLISVEALRRYRARTEQMVVLKGLEVGKVSLKVEDGEVLGVGEDVEDVGEWVMGEIKRTKWEEKKEEEEVGVSYLEWKPVVGGGKVIVEVWTNGEEGCESVPVYVHVHREGETVNDGGDPSYGRGLKAVNTARKSIQKALESKNANIGLIILCTNIGTLTDHSQHQVPLSLLSGVAGAETPKTHPILLGEEGAETPKKHPILFGEENTESSKKHPILLGEEGSESSKKHTESSKKHTESATPKKLIPQSDTSKTYPPSSASSASWFVSAVAAHSIALTLQIVQENSLKTIFPLPSSSMALPHLSDFSPKEWPLAPNPPPKDTEDSHPSLSAFLTKPAPNPPKTAIQLIVIPESPCVDLETHGFRQVL